MPTLEQVAKAIRVLEDAGLIENGAVKPQPRKGKRTKITPEMVKEGKRLLRLHPDWSWARIAKRVGCSPAGIASHLR